MKKIFLFIFLLQFLLSCTSQEQPSKTGETNIPSNVLNFQGTPTSLKDRSSLAFSDMGAWFAYGFPDTKDKTLGFSGPLLLTQGQGEWCSKSLSKLSLINTTTKQPINLDDISITQTSYNSHLVQVLENKNIKITQTLFYNSAHSAIITTEITNQSNETIQFTPCWNGTLYPSELQIQQDNHTISLPTSRSSALGKIQTFNDEVTKITSTDSTYTLTLNNFELVSNQSKKLTLSHTFIFPEYDAIKEQVELSNSCKNPLKALTKRINEKETQFNKLNNKLASTWQDSIYQTLVAKTTLTLQNNTRIAAGELKHKGIFPSYHYEWFLGFWAWDSWKHAVAVAHYDTELAKNQIRAMYDYQLENGFIVDCIFRDTTLEKHNYRNTKPPLSAWSVWKVYEQDKDINFIKELYPKIVKQHNWWYTFRDYDNDGVCEYGSTDGTLIAAKWESGMDNAVRFDDSKMVQSDEAVFSLNQESVDLNAYLYAEKQYLILMADLLDNKIAAEELKTAAKKLKAQIQYQFYDEKTGWFYDTSIDGKSFIKVMGCEGWIPLWANVASIVQAESVKQNMMNPDYFNTKVPFQTLSANHPKFKPNRGYWRGPNWLDQAYFGVKGLRNYGYQKEANESAYKLIHNANGVLTKGYSIRENYQPITGEGLESENFSWSAAHYLLLMLDK